MQRCSKFNVPVLTIFCLLVLVVPFVFTEVSNSGGDGTLGRMGDRWWKNYELVEELLQGPDIETLEVDEILVTTRPPVTTPRRTVTRQPTPFQIEEVSNTIRHLQTSRATPRPVPVPVSVTRRTTATTRAAITTTSEESTPFPDHTLPFTSNIASTAQDGEEDIPKKPHRGRLRLRIRKPSSASPQAAASSEVKIVSSIRPPSSTQPSSFLPARDVRVFHRYSLLDTVKPNILLTDDQSVSESSNLGVIDQHPIPRRRRMRKGKRINQSTAATTESTGITDFEVLTTVKRVVKRDTKPLSRIVRQSATDIAPMDPEAISTQILSGVSPSRLSPQRANKDPSKQQADGDINTFVAAQILSGVIPTKDAHLKVEASTAEPSNETTTEYPPFEQLEAFVAGQILSGASKWMRKSTDAKPAEAVQAQDDVHQQILSGIRPGQARSTTPEPTTTDSTTASTTSSTTELTTTLEPVTESTRKRFKVRRRTTTTAAAIPESEDTQETSTVADVPVRPRRPLRARARSRREASDSGVWFSDLGPEPAVITDNTDTSNKNKGVQKKMPSEASSVSLESSSGGDDPVIKGPSTKQIQESTAVEPDSSGLWFGFMDDVVTTSATASTSKKPSSRSRMGIEVVEAETVSRSEMMASSSAKRSTNVPPIPLTRGQKRRASKNDTARFAALERELNSVMITTEKYPEENDEYLHGTKLASESSDVETTADVNSTSSFRISSSADEQPIVATRKEEATTTQPLFRREEEKPRVREETIRLVSDRTKIAQAIAERARRRKEQQRRPAAVSDSQSPPEQGEQVEPVEQSPVFEDVVTTTTTTERLVTSARPTVRISATEILTRPPTPPPSLEILETRRSPSTPSPPRVTSTLPPPPALPLAPPTVKSKKSGSDEIGYFGAEDDLSSSSAADSGRGGEVAAGEAPSLGALDEPSFHDGSSVADQPEQPMAQEEVAGGGEVDHGDDGPLAPEHAGGGESSAWDVVGGPSFNVEVFVNRKNLNGDMRGGGHVSKSRIEVLKMFSGSGEDNRHDRKPNISAVLRQMFAKRDDHDGDERFEPREILETLLLATNTTLEDLDPTPASAEIFDDISSKAKDETTLNSSPSSISKKCDHCFVENSNSSMSFSGAPSDCERSSRNICPVDDNYPIFMVKSVIEKHGETLSAILDTLRHDVDPADIFLNESGLEVDTEVAVCDTTVENVRPGWAKDAQTDQWMVIVNLDRYLQTVRVESCIRENSTCLFISPYYKSLCLEHFSVHRLVAIDPRYPEKGPAVGVFKMPCGCSCKVEMIREQ